jgi:hypothetical protein
MKGNIMDKKILLSGAAAIIMGVGVVAAPAQASISLSIGGEAKITAGFSACGVTADTAIGLNAGFAEMDGVSAPANEAALEDAIEAINTTDSDLTAEIRAADFANVTSNLYWDASGSAVVENSGTVATADVLIEAKSTTAPTYTYIADPCGNGVDRNGIDWGFGKELSIAASGTLANGLSVSFSDTLDLTDTNAETGAFSMTLGGNFGSLNFKEGGGDAVGKARVAGDADYSVNGTNLGFHGSKTTGHGGMGILWTAPSVGDLDLYVGWSPNSGGDGLDNAAYENTFSVAAVMDVSALTVGVGYATANATDGNGCAALAAGDFAGGTMVALADHIYGGDYCGDQTLMHVAASMDAGEISLGAGYSVQDTDEADKTVMHIDASTSMGGYDLGLGYRQTTKAYEFDNKEDKQNVVAASIGTSLGDGLDLSLTLSNSDIDLIAETNNTAATNGDNSLMFAEVELKASF